MIDLAVVDLSRLQFALTALYHFLFVPLTIGLAVIIAIMETVFVAVDAADDTKVLGWVGAAKASTRSVFHGVVEDSIYTHPDARGRGIAGALLDHLIQTCINLHKWSIHSWIFPENEGSAGLHRSRGFEKVGTFHNMAQMAYGERKGQWRDCDIYELILPMSRQP